MLGVRQYALAGSLVLLSLLACDRDPPLAPSTDASFSANTPPSDAGAAPVSASQINVSWTDNTPNETGFEVHRSTTGPDGTYEALSPPTAANVTTYSDMGLTASTQYCYKVRSLRTTVPKTTYTAFSNVTCATTFGPPATPSNANATPPFSNAVDVTWTDNSGTESGFRLDSAATAEGPWNPVATTGPNVTSYRDWSRASEQQVCYRVIAFNSYGESGPSNVDCTVPPAAPSNLTATGTQDRAIDLAWVDNSKFEDGYEVHRAGADLVWSVIASLPVDAKSYHDATVSPDTRYWYRVRAKKDGGYSYFSNYADAFTAGSPPSAPSNARAVPNGSTGVVVSWTDQSVNGDGFRLERATDGGATCDGTPTAWATIGTSPWNQPSFVDAGLTSDQHVWYRVFAFNGKGESGPSNIACTAPPRAPTNLQATAVAGLAIDLTWLDNSEVEDGYEVWREFTDCSYYYGCYSYYSPIATLAPNVTSYRDAGLNPGETYFYYVVAFKDSGYNRGYSDPSIVASATAQ